ncbi:FirrV-1-B28 [Feldmannia irregularis virus a]|uniref:FirrV-1-B28 n=1 Tax=Feldmannia irregularis virus a TaxID=231992 RepID=Q6XM08_9PHYC|nr:FirrV-1-B28 [Feldmannia irregularis virus a]AAR26903.1 FirrV-1-B28 [Feldmannia irregularis virus a]
MVGTIRSVEEIVGISESGKTPDKMVYRYLIKQIDRLIRSRALEQRYDAHFEIPAIVMFKPHFNRLRVAKKICAHYTKIGFIVELTGFHARLAWGKGTQTDKKKTEDSKHSSDSEDPRHDIGQVTDEEEESSNDEEEEDRTITIKNSHVKSTLSQRLAQLKQQQQTQQL